MSEIAGMAGRAVPVSGAATVGAAIAVLHLVVVTMVATACSGVGSTSADTGHTIVIMSPSSGAKVDVGVNTPVNVVAEHQGGIVRLELWVDGEMVDTAPSPSGEPVDQMQASLFWVPDAPHSYALTVRAYDWQDAVLGTTTQVVNASTSLEQTAAQGDDSTGDTDIPASERSAGINFFRADAEHASPGDIVALEWSVSGAPSAEIIRHLPDGDMADPVRVTSAGQINVEMLIAESSGASFTLHVPLGEAAALSETVTIDVRCVDDWFFEEHPPGCAQGAAALVPAVEQHFEGGVMLQLYEVDRIYLLYDESVARTWEVFEGFDRSGADGQTSTESPPDGFHAPQGVLGSMWRNQPNVRSRLGWALDEQVVFTAALQTTSRDHDNVTFLRSVDGAVYRLEPGGAGWSENH